MVHRAKEVIDHLHQEGGVLAQVEPLVRVTANVPCVLGLLGITFSLIMLELGEDEVKEKVNLASIFSVLI